MQVKIGRRVLLRGSFKRILYSLCFCMFCVIDQRVRTANGSAGWLETFRDLTGVVMAVVIMSHYKRSDFLRWRMPYLVWSIAAMMGCAVAFYWGTRNQICLKDWFVVLLNVFLYGYIVIHTFISVAIEKRVPKLNRRFAVLWLIMMVLMVVSRSNYIWPFCYLVMFGCFYLTNYDKEEQEDLFQGMLNGIILGFFIIQGLCFVFRPYDEIRYKGMYLNTNINALFYLEVLAAVLTKIVCATKTNSNKWLRIYYWLGAGTVLSFLFMTIGRTAWMTAFVLGVFFLWGLKKIQGKKIFKNGIALILCMCVTFPLCFGAVRYLPPLFHHPVWFAGEWNTDRVHSWDPWDSEKYVELDELMDSAVGRIVKSVTDILKHSPFLLHTDAAEAEGGYVLTSEEGKDGILMRYTIYAHYATRLNFWGHPKEGQGFQVTEGYFAWHAHNIFLQYGTDFGIIVMVLFAVVSIGACLILRKNFLISKSELKLGYLFFALVPILYGLFECSWRTGALSILTMFVAWREVICMHETSGNIGDIRQEKLEE